MGYQALVIDDNNVCAAVLSALLKKCGITTVIEENGLAALEREDLTSFDLIFADYFMPELDGVETADRIHERAAKQGRNVPVILCTANVNEVKDRQQENIFMILQKPVKRKELELVLESCISRNFLSLEENTGAAEKTESLKISGLDTSYAIKTSGDADIYIKILKEYYNAIDEKINAIRRYAQNFELEAFKIEVHGLKSASRLIGALEFAEFCEKLEKECANYNEEKLLEAAEQFICRYGGYREVLKPYAVTEMPEKSRQKADMVQVKQWLGELRAALDDFDFDEAEKLITCMKQHQLPENYEKVADELQEKLQNIDYDGGIAIIDTVL